MKLDRGFDNSLWYDKCDYKKLKAVAIPIKPRTTVSDTVPLLEQGWGANIPRKYHQINARSTRLRAYHRHPNIP